ncbi:MAG TPA: T9SS type A sorting domain-containing protein [Bacteroidia bacterium]|nr:T9SS type A sorting domain-containing protein [Bacteroidia bacterium]HNU34330.1 T9SS type A sorting domain-containing protein [Bacteroidia bacterium]
MIKVKMISAAFFLCCAYFSTAQNSNSIWCFGDSALIDFSDTSNIITGTSQVKSRGSCASIADSTGELLFYVSYDPSVIIAGTDPVKVYNANHQVMANGDSMKGGGWYNEITIIPFPGSDTLFYVFYIGVTLDIGLYYSLINISSNGGLGQVIQKNVQLQNTRIVDCLTAIKHGNGRDWWIIFRKWQQIVTPDDTFYSYLITPNGVSSVHIQNIGTTHSTGFGNIIFNSEGSKMMYLNVQGLLELYDFDRCTGLLSNPNNTYPEQSSPFTRTFWGGSFSPSGNIFYCSTVPLNQSDTSRILQYDLNSPNVAASCDTLRETTFSESMGALKLAPDKRIYVATNYYQFFPYKDTVYNTTNMNLSVINSPDSLGAACDFQTYSFYLGGKRTYLGLPNNPDYDMPALTGSICDTITSIANNPLQTLNPKLFVSYISDWQKLFINAQNLKGKNITLTIYDATGKLIYTKDRSNAQSGYYTHNINCANFATGMYIINLVTEKEKISKKFSVIK